MCLLIEFVIYLSILILSTINLLQTSAIELVDKYNLINIKFAPGLVKITVQYNCAWQ